MAKLLLFDGTRDPFYGTVLGRVLAEIGRLIPVSCFPDPGSIDLKGYNLVISLVKKHTNRDEDR